MTTTDDVLSAAHATNHARRARILTYSLMITGGAYVVVLMYAIAVKSIPYEIHVGAIVTLVVGTIATALEHILAGFDRLRDELRADAGRAAAERQAAADRLERERQGVYEVLIRRLRDNGHRIAEVYGVFGQLREMTYRAEVRTADVRRLRGALTMLGEVIATTYRGHRSQATEIAEGLPAAEVERVAEEAEEAGFRRGLVAAVNSPGEVVSINGRRGAQSSPSGRS